MILNSDLCPEAQVEHVHEDGLELWGEHGVHQEVHAGVHQHQVLHHSIQLIGEKFVTMDAGMGE